MEEPLLVIAEDWQKDQGEISLSSSSSSLSLLRWEVVVGEMKKVVYIAMPMMVSRAAIAPSLTNVTRFSLLVGTINIISLESVSNELDAGHAEAARLAAWVATFLAVIETVIASTTLFSCRSILGYAFGDEKELVDYVKEMTPFLWVARGVGRQRLAAYVNLGAFYLCGIPMACVLAFVFQWRGKGLWIGLATASLLQSSMLIMITFFTDWEKQARNTRKRIFEGRSQLSTIE
ncbi:hypothetical protein AgCh_015747 [Apium graveolens]